jgi:hypothetical protein
MINQVHFESESSGGVFNGMYLHFLVSSAFCSWIREVVAAQDFFLTCIYYLVQVILTFEEPEVGLTVVKLTQTNVPDEDRYVK